MNFLLLCEEQILCKLFFYPNVKYQTNSETQERKPVSASHQTLKLGQGLVIEDQRESAGKIDAIQRSINKSAKLKSHDHLANNIVQRKILENEREVTKDEVLSWFKEQSDYTDGDELPSTGFLSKLIDETWSIDLSQFHGSKDFKQYLNGLYEDSEKEDVGEQVADDLEDPVAEFRKKHPQALELGTKDENILKGQKYLANAKAAASKSESLPFTFGKADRISHDSGQGYATFVAHVGETVFVIAYGEHSNQKGDKGSSAVYTLNWKADKVDDFDSNRLELKD